MKLPKWNRTWRTARNLFLLALTVFAAAWMLQFPAWTKAGLLCRAEQQYFLEASELLFTGDEGGPHTLYARNGDLLLAVVYSRTLMGYQLNWSHLLEEPDGIYCDARDYNCTEFMAFGALEHVETAELEVTHDITVSGVNELHETYVAQGIRVNPYCFRFVLERHFEETDNSVAARAEERIFELRTVPECRNSILRLYDVDGRLIHEKTIDWFEVEALGW